MTSTDDLTPLESMLADSARRRWLDSQDAVLLPARPAILPTEPTR